MRKVIAPQAYIKLCLTLGLIIATVEAWGWSKCHTPAFNAANGKDQLPATQPNTSRAQGDEACEANRASPGPHQLQQTHLEPRGGWVWAKIGASLKLHVLVHVNTIPKI